jgi:hypothetical protein
LPQLWGKNPPQKTAMFCPIPLVVKAAIVSIIGGHRQLPIKEVGYDSAGTAKPGVPIVENQQHFTNDNSVSCVNLQQDQGWHVP